MALVNARKWLTGKDGVLVSPVGIESLAWTTMGNWATTAWRIGDAHPGRGAVRRARRCDCRRRPAFHDSAERWHAQSRRVQAPDDAV